jgi:ADP-ribose pyrophosphatase
MVSVAERTVSSREVFSGRLLHLRVDDVELDSGRHAVREVVVHPGAVAILPWDGERLTLVRQWRQAAGRSLLEVPAGTLDGGEAPGVAAARELAEEVQLAADDWQEGPGFYTAPGFSTEYLTVFLASGLHPAPDGAADDDEELTIERLTLAEALQAIDDGGIQDAKSIVAILWLARHLAPGY